MSARKPLDPACDGGIHCRVPEHVVIRPKGRHGFVVSHIKLTPGQNKTLAERRLAAR